MALLDEIRAKCSPELISSKEHGAIAAVVSMNRTEVRQTLGGIGTVLETLGPIDGAALLDQLEALSPSNSAVKWAFVLINRGELDFGSNATRAMIDQLVTDQAAAAALKAVAMYDAPVSATEVAKAMEGM